MFVFIFVPFGRCGCVLRMLGSGGRERFVSGILEIVVMAQPFDIGARDARLNSAWGFFLGNKSGSGNVSSFSGWSHRRSRSEF